MGDIDLYQIALLIDQLKHDDLQLRVNASNSLTQIATALGPERTRNELIPFLEDTTDDEDEVLLVIAEKLGELRNCIGGVEHAHCLLPPLRLLATVEEVSVRQATVKSLDAIVDTMSNDMLTRYYMPFVLELAGQDWFTARISAVGLFARPYSRLPEASRRHWRSVFLRLCVDESPIVRRNALTHMGAMAQVVQPAEVLEEFMGVFSSQATDQQDSVRIQIIPNCAALAPYISMEQQKALIVPVVLNIGADKSWRVRWTLANELPNICNTLGRQLTGDHLAVTFETLLNDSEAEVRCACAANISKVCTVLNKDRIISKVLPITQRLVTDSSEGARAALASVINELATILGREDTVAHLLPMLLLLLRDEASDVRLSVISNLASINKVVGVDLLSQSLLPAIVDLSEDPKWRVRLAIIEHVPMLAEQLGKDFFTDRLANLCMVWLGDDVWTVRRAAAENLKKLVKVFGGGWSVDSMMPRIDRLHVHTNYLHRMTSLYAIQALITCLSVPQIELNLLPISNALTADAVPNVRFTASKTLSQLHTALGQDMEQTRSTIYDTLMKLTTDTDRDVRYFSKNAIKEISAGL
jgi:serine/threonine-protein phosphatase 2A regulatory subunit A